MKACPIKLDSILIRYLHDIEFEYDRSNTHNTTRSVFIKTYLPEETKLVTKEVDCIHDTFKEYCKSNNMLEFGLYSHYLRDTVSSFDEVAFNDTYMNALYSSRPFFELYYEVTTHVKVLDIKKLRKFISQYCFIPDTNSMPHLIDDNERLLFMNSVGDVFYDKNRKDLLWRIKQDNLFYKIFVCIYLSTHGSGQTTLHEVNKRMSKDFKKKVNIKQIQNAFNLSIKKDIKLILPTGEKLVEANKNGIIIFNNPKISLG